MTLRPLIALVALLLAPTAVAMPACDANPTSESQASAQHDAGPHQPQHRQNDRTKPGPCLGCVAPSTARPPVLEAPNRALMLIPASVVRVSHALKPAAPTTPPPKQG